MLDFIDVLVGQTRLIGRLDSLKLNIRGAMLTAGAGHGAFCQAVTQTPPSSGVSRFWAPLSGFWLLRLGLGPLRFFAFRVPARLPAGDFRDLTTLREEGLGLLGQLGSRSACCCIGHGSHL